MRIRFWMKAFVMVPTLCLAGLSAAAQPQGSSQQQTGDAVADAARKAREAKKDAPKPKKIITDEDLKKSTPTPDAGAGSAPGGAGGTAAATTVQVAGEATKGVDPSGELAWRKRFKDAHDQIAMAEKELDILGRELEKSQLEYYPDPQKAMNEQNKRAEVNDKRAKIDAKKHELDQLRKGLDDLEEQLRKSGGDPGWAR
jgi:hypothetical protein